MDIPLLPFIKSSKRVKRYGGGAVKCTVPFSSDTPNMHGNTKTWRTTTSHGVQDLPPPAQLLRKSSNSSGRKRSREIGGIEQHLAQLKRKQIEITSDNSEVSSIDMLLSENTSPQEVPSSPIFKKARNSFSDLNPQFYTEAEDNHTYQVSIDHDWEETPVDVSVPKVTVKRIRKPNLPFTTVTSTHQESLFQGENHFLQLRPAVKQIEMLQNATFNHHRCDDDPCSTSAMLNILPHEE